MLRNYKEMMEDLLPFLSLLILLNKFYFDWDRPTVNYDNFICVHVH